MALKAVIDSLDQVDEALQAYYDEQDDKFILKIEGLKDHPETGPLRRAKDHEKARRAEIQAQLDAALARLDGLPDDFDADAYEALKAASDGKEPQKDEQVVRIREQLEKKHQSELAKKADEASKLRAQLERLTVDEGLSRAMDKANINPDFKEDILPSLKQRAKIKLDESDEGVSALVETDMGDVSLDRYVADWASSDRGQKYVSKAQGIGATGSDGRKLDNNPFTAKAWNKTEQSRLKTSDPAKAEKAAVQAGFKDLEKALMARKPIEA